MVNIYGKIFKYQPRVSDLFNPIQKLKFKEIKFVLQLMLAVAMARTRAMATFTLLY
jgi:hypothetical protein